MRHTEIYGDTIGDRDEVDCINNGEFGENIPGLFILKELPLQPPIVWNKRSLYSRFMDIVGRLLLLLEYISTS